MQPSETKEIKNSKGAESVYQRQNTLLITISAIFALVLFDGVVFIRNVKVNVIIQKYMNVSIVLHATTRQEEA
jgi:hypothetical protein